MLKRLITWYVLLVLFSVVMLGPGLGLAKMDMSRVTQRALVLVGR